MADFSFLSDTDESAVEELVSQAKELSVLEQVAAINCSGFTETTVLPNDLETRFRRLKSLPDSRPDPESVLPSKKTKKKKQVCHSKSAVTFPAKKRDSESRSAASSDDGERIFSESKQKPGREFGGSLSSSDDALDATGEFSDQRKIGIGSSNSSRESKVFSAAKHTPKGKSIIRSASSSIKTASLASTDLEHEQRSESKSKSSSSWLNLLSPSKAIGCMRRSPKKSSNSKTMKNNKSSNASSDRGNAMDFDEFLSDLGDLTVDEQRKMLKEAIREQQKMRREAAEIIKMAKHASSRFDFND